MPKYSKTSEANLKSCHSDLQVIFNEVIKHFDHSILCGHRGENEQNEAFRSGNSKLTYPNSKHNKVPSLAVDALPFPINWKDTNQMILFAGYVQGVAMMLHAKGLISHELRWGGDWNRNHKTSDERFKDYPHFELI
jgi:peptidoglycan L-alanyl-D-glutamate endopeptidase CwlK